MKVTVPNVEVPDAETQRAVPPPWELSGTALLFLERGLFAPRLRARALVHYTHSPVGVYNEVAVAALTQRGLSVVDMPVNLEASRVGGRAGWGYPKSLAAIEWHQHSNRVLVRFEGRVWRARVFGPLFPVRLSASTAQTLNGEDVRAPFHIAGRARLAWNGRRLALFVEEFQLLVSPPQEENL
jgi:hypothetical protein